MSDLSSIEKIKLERLFEMEGGYVLSFSNRTFQEFFQENLGIDIYDGKYDYDSGSKANRLRAFWKKEPNYQVGLLLTRLLEFWRENKILNNQTISLAEQGLFDECKKIAERLSCGSSVELDEISQTIPDSQEFSLLTKLIRERIQNNEPEAALDRLHTYVVKYIRKLCVKHGVNYKKDTTLNSLFGSYVKILTQNNLIESKMSERILKYSISLLESFNTVRNEQSLAHDNPILNYQESLLIFRNVVSLISFIQSIEDEISSSQAENVYWDDIPF